MGAMARAQPTLQRPEGLVLDQTFLSEEEERELLARIESLDFRAVVMRGAVARRTVRGYGARDVCRLVMVGNTLYDGGRIEMGSAKSCHFGFVARSALRQASA